MVGASVAGAAGLVVHNLPECPWQVLYHAETAGPIALTGLLAEAALLRPGRATALLLGGWGLVTVVGGAPHYAVHVAYAAAQVPLLRIGRRALNRTRPTPMRTPGQPGTLHMHDATGWTGRAPGPEPGRPDQPAGPGHPELGDLRASTPASDPALRRSESFCPYLTYL